MKLPLLTLAISLAALSQLATAQNNTIEPFDGPAAGRPHSDAPLHANPGGTLPGKSLRPAAAHSAAMPAEPASCSEVRIRVNGDTAVMTARFATSAGPSNGVRERYAAVWVRRNGQWLRVTERGAQIARR